MLPMMIETDEAGLEIRRIYDRWEWRAAARLGVETPANPRVSQYQIGLERDLDVWYETVRAENVLRQRALFARSVAMNGKDDPWR